MPTTDRKRSKRAARRKKISQFHSLGCAISSSFPFFLSSVDRIANRGFLSFHFVLLFDSMRELYSSLIRQHLLLRLFTCDHAYRELATSSILILRSASNNAIKFKFADKLFHASFVIKSMGNANVILFGPLFSLIDK